MIIICYVTSNKTQYNMGYSIMGFKDQNGYSLINEEHKIRITLSNRAKLTLEEDMSIFKTEKITTFINLVFENYRSEAKSSISLYLEQKRLEIDPLFDKANLSASSKELAIDCLLKAEEEILKKLSQQYLAPKGTSHLYHINNQNVGYLEEDCEEDRYYERPGLYLRAVIEEYCSLPFIERERIYKKKIYEVIEAACSNKEILKIQAPYNGKNQSFYVYPYKIVADSFQTQSYLVCYSRKAEETDKDKIIASFSMARINVPEQRKKTFHLTKQEINNIEKKLAVYSPTYLIEPPALIKVKLTPGGIRRYQSNIYSRPSKIEELSTDDIYVFDCTPQQIYNYFFPFGSKAEIISPDYVREIFITAYSNALKIYTIC